MVHTRHAGTYQEYVDRKKKKNEKPMSKDDWDARQNGGQKEESVLHDKTPMAVHKDLFTLLGQWGTSGDPIYAVSSNAAGGHPIPKKIVDAALAQLKQKVADPSLNKKDVSQLKKAIGLLEKATPKGKTAMLRNHTIRLASTRPDVRSELLRIIKACDCAEGPTQAKFEEGKPADPTENMSEEDANKWRIEHLKNKDNFKNATLRAALIRLASANPAVRKDVLNILREAGCEKLPEGGMRDNCEKKQDEASKTASTVHVRLPMQAAVQILTISTKNSVMGINGVLMIQLPNTEETTLRFNAQVMEGDAGYDILSFATVPPLSGNADDITNLLTSVLQEVLIVKGEQLLQQ